MGQESILRAVDRGGPVSFVKKPFPGIVTAAQSLAPVITGSGLAISYRH